MMISFLGRGETYARNSECGPLDFPGESSIDAPTGLSARRMARTRRTDAARVLLSVALSLMIMYATDPETIRVADV